MRQESEVQRIVQGLEQERKNVFETEVSTEDEVEAGADKLNMLIPALVIGHAILGTKDEGIEKYDLARFKKNFPQTIQDLFDEVS